MPAIFAQGLYREHSCYDWRSLWTKGTKARAYNQSQSRHILPDNSRNTARLLFNRFLKIIKCKKVDIMFSQLDIVAFQGKRKAINCYCDTNLCYVMLSRDFSWGFDQRTPVGCGLFRYCYLSKKSQNQCDIMIFIKPLLKQ